MGDKMQATGPLFDDINLAVADAIYRAIEKGADPMAAISAVVISAADFGRLVLGDDILVELADTLAMQKGKPLPKIGRWACCTGRKGEAARGRHFWRLSAPASVPWGFCLPFPIGTSLEALPR